MRISGPLALLAACATMVPRAVAAEPDLRFADPASNAGAVIGWQALWRGPFGNALATQLPPLSDLENAALSSLLTGTESVTLTSSGSFAAVAARPEWLIVLSGKFDLDLLRPAMADFGYRPDVYASVEVLTRSPDHPRSTAVALVDSTTIVIGEQAVVRKAIGRHVGRMPGQDRGAGPRIALPGTTGPVVLELVGLGSPLAYYPRAGTLPPGLPEIQNYRATLEIADVAQLSLEFQTSSAEDAGALAAILNAIPYLVRVRPGEVELVKQIAANTQISVQETSVRVVTRCPTDEIARRLSAVRKLAGALNALPSKRR